MDRRNAHWSVCSGVGGKHAGFCLVVRSIPSQIGGKRKASVESSRSQAQQIKSAEKLEEVSRHIETEAAIRNRFVPWFVVRLKMKLIALRNSFKMDNAKGT